jgi:UDP-glucuronate decarboxylase
MSRKVLVTGGAGFLGSHLCASMLKAGNFVLCLDNFSTGRRENIRHLLGNPRFQLVDHDVTEPFDYEVDLVCNLACPASPVHYQADAIKTTLTSFLGALNALNLAKKYGAHMLQASTSEVYGDPLVHPQKEEYWGNVNPIGPRSCYDEGKRIAESLCCDYKRQHGVRVKIVRIFNTFGPRMQPDDGRVVSNFIIQALQDKPLTVYGDGTQTRSFCYVDDLIEGIMRFVDSPDTFCGPMNLGNPVEYSVAELAQIILKLTHSRSEIAFCPLPINDPKIRKPDIALAQTLGWYPRVPLEQGLLETITYFKGLIASSQKHAALRSPAIS